MDSIISDHSFTYTHLQTTLTDGVWFYIDFQYLNSMATVGLNMMNEGPGERTINGVVLLIMKIKRYKLIRLYQISVDNNPSIMMIMI